MATTFSLKQGETGTRHGPIPHPLTYKKSVFLKFDMLTDMSKLAQSHSNPICKGVIFIVFKSIGNLCISLFVMCHFRGKRIGRDLHIQYIKADNLIFEIDR